MTIKKTIEYYQNNEVIQRMIEFCGIPTEIAKTFHKNGQPLNSSNELYRLTKEFNSEFLVGWGGKLLREIGDEKKLVQNSNLSWLLEEGLDMNRSVWDNKNTLGIIDIEFDSKKNPGKIYTNAEDTFWKMEPFYQTMKKVFNDYKINTLNMATGQGYHYIFKVPQNTPAHKELENIAKVENTLNEKYCHVKESKKFKRNVTDQEAKGFEGMGKIIEFLIHKAIKLAPDYGNKLPLTIGDTGGKDNKSDAINLDLSMYGSPLHIRAIRFPFSSHHKHKIQHWKISRALSKKIPIQISIPRYTPCNNNELSMDELFFNRRNFNHCADYAKAINTEIPLVKESIEDIIKDYKKSQLYLFHKEFDSIEHDAVEKWPRTYDLYSGEEKNLKEILKNPAPALLQPANIKKLTDRLMDKGWHPKHIAGLIRSKYERDHGWAKKEKGNWNFYRYDASAHANKWVRFYAGLKFVDLDK